MVCIRTRVNVHFRESGHYREQKNTGEDGANGALTLNPREGGDIYLTPMNMTTKPTAGDKKKPTEESNNADD